MLAFVPSFGPIIVVMTVTFCFCGATSTVAVLKMAPLDLNYKGAEEIPNLPAHPSSRLAKSPAGSSSFSYPCCYQSGRRLSRVQCRTIASGNSDGEMSAGVETGQAAATEVEESGEEEGSPEEGTGKRKSKVRALYYLSCTSIVFFGIRF